MMPNSESAHRGCGEAAGAGSHRSDSGTGRAGPGSGHRDPALSPLSRPRRPALAIHWQDSVSGTGGRGLPQCSAAQAHWHAGSRRAGLGPGWGPPAESDLEPGHSSSLPVVGGWHG
jgi:hypothetical protein